MKQISTNPKFKKFNLKSNISTDHLQRILNRLHNITKIIHNFILMFEPVPHFLFKVGRNMVEFLNSLLMEVLSVRLDLL